MVIYQKQYLIILYVGKYHNYLVPFRRHLLCQSSTNVGKSPPLFYPFLNEGDTYSTNVIHNFGLLTEYQCFLHML